MARLVKAGETLRNQMNTRFPRRDKSSDGWIGDAAHQSRPSDHNPDSRGWVHALDIDEDFGLRGDNRKLADQLVAYARDRRKGSERLKYVVYEDKVASGTYANTFWVFRGSGYGHTHHIHVSFTPAAENNGKPFDLPIFNPAAVWDGNVPSLASVKEAEKDEEVKNKAAWQLAGRLKDLGHYLGNVNGVGKQAYPINAVKTYQSAVGLVPTGKYSAALHKRIFDLI